MYLSCYNLRERPFQINSDPRFLWLGEQHKEALATLIYGVQDQRGFLLLTGDVGTGKTTLVNALLEKLDKSILVGNITNPKLGLMGFLNIVSASLGLPERPSKKEDFLLGFTRFLNEKYTESKYVLLIIDEAHTLSSDHLEQIRLLSNIELPERSLISIFLVGQNELNETLTSHECRALRQRITLISRVEPLSEGETNEYIRHRLRIAGRKQELFSQAAVREIHHFSHGYPRLINNLCDHALLTGYVRQSRRITPDLIKECGQEMLLLGEHIESSPQSLSGNPKLAPLAHSGEQPQKSGSKPLSQSGGNKENLRGIQELWSWMRAKKRLKWAMWAFPLLLILPFTAIFRTDLFSGRSAEMATSASDPSIIQLSPANPTSTAPPEETPDGKYEESEITATEVSPAVEQKSLPEPEALVHTSNEGKEDDPTTEAMPGTEANSTLSSIEDALKDRDFKRGIELSEKFMAGDASPPPRLRALYSELLLNQAEILSGKDIVSSEDLLNRAVSADPKNLKALLLLGKLYTGHKQYDKALETYQKAIDLNPDMPGLFFNLGFLYAAKDDYAHAETAFTRAIELSPSYLDKALFNLAVVQDKQGKRDASLQSLRRALEANPNNEKARELLERVEDNS